MPSLAASFLSHVSRYRSGWGLALLGAVAVAARLGLLLIAGVHAEGNAYEHGEIAKNLLAGHGFSVKFLGVDGPTSQQAPLYPYLLAASSLCRGGSAPSLRAVEILQCFAGAGIALAVAGLGWTLYPRQRSVGWCAGAIAAVFPTHLYMATQIQVVVWATLLLTLVMLAACRAPGNRPMVSSILLGLLAGLLLLVEPIGAVALPVAALAAWRRDCRQHGARWYSRGPLARAALTAAVALVVIAPWLVRNHRVHGEFVFVKSTFGYAFWQGNNEASWGTDKVPKPTAEALRINHDGTLAGIHRALWQARHETIYIDDLLLQPGGYQEFQGLSEPARSRLLAARAVAAIQHDPLRYLKLCAQRFRYFLTIDATNPKAANPLYRATTAAWLVLTVLGLLVSRSDWRTLWPTWGVCAAITLFHTLTITSARFRLPLEPLTFVWIAAGLAPLAGRLGAHYRAAWAACARHWPGRSPQWRDTRVLRREPPAPHIPLSPPGRPHRRAHRSISADSRAE
ncbi:MAG: hypothetical protein JNG90_04460 [Planctomycetaceae bacterium]|nr:hypothetical protein [Planctomycetaceae bacterium]